MATFVLVNGIGDAVISFRGSLVRDLVARGHRVVVSTPTPLERSAMDVERAIKDLGGECVFAPLDRTGTNPVRELLTRRHYRTLFERIKPDGVFAANPKPVFHAIPAAKHAGVSRRVAMITGLGYAFTGSSFKARLLRIIASRLYRNATRAATTTIFQNPDDRAYFEQAQLITRDSDVRMTGGSGVDLIEFSPVAAPTSAPVFLMIARLLGDKGVREFAHAARVVRAQRADCQFRLVGWIDGNPAAIAQAELDRWIAAGDIVYAGRLDDVRAELASCSVFVLPSYREGTPKSTLEALATGRPVITTDAPGCRETVMSDDDECNGILVPARDGDALAHACLSLALDEERRVRMGHHSRALAERRFDVRLVNATIMDALGA